MRPFLDTNVLVYMVDRDEPEKRAVARALVEKHLFGGDGVISVQVLREFYAAVRKLRTPLPEDEARELLEELALFAPMPEDSRMVLGAARRSRELSISFWDALILESALREGADRLLSEDLQHGQSIEGLRVENPFLGVSEG